MAKGLECSGVDHSKFKFRNRFVVNKGNGKRQLGHSTGSSDGLTPDAMGDTGNGRSPERRKEPPLKFDSDGHYCYQMNFDFWDDAATSLYWSPPLVVYTLDHISPWQHILLEHCEYNNRDTPSSE